MGRVDDLNAIIIINVIIIINSVLVLMMYY